MGKPEEMELDESEDVVLEKEQSKPEGYEAENWPSVVNNLLLQSPTRLFKSTSLAAGLILTVGIVVLGALWTITRAGYQFTIESGNKAMKLFPSDER